MATVVLTAVGAALGGPIGGALGALAGNALDHAVIRPKGREGARLNDLRVQGSSYGAPIARVWGTMRVAGTVIWATDLIERRMTSGGGKGQAAATTYGYAASFAVLLTGRPIMDVGRIWADGQLLRGAAGDWKATTGFRLHVGNEDQAVDPLIAGAVGAGVAPAYRGCAYAVFEQLDLSTFGNRIPSLSFEVIADAGTVDAGAVARGLAAEVAGAAALPLDGYLATDGTVRDALDALAEAAGGWWAGLALRDVAPPALAVTGDPARDGRDMAAADRVPALVSVSHYDPARDWQAGLQRARAPGPGSAVTIALPAGLTAVAAKGVAEAALRRGAAARVRRTVAAPLSALTLAPGDAAIISGDAGPWRVTATELTDTGLTLALVPLTTAPVAVAASGGAALATPDAPAGVTLLHAAELPGLDDTPATQPRLCVWATGTGAGWRGAGLLLSLDEGASWTAAGGTAAPAVIGVVDTAPPPAPATLVDRAGTLEVTLARADMMLADADADRLDAGVNLALVGGELLQFGRAEPLGGGRWRLRELWRGRRGTETATVRAGDRFVLVEAATTRVLDLPLTALAGNAALIASGVGDAEPVPAMAAVTGVSIAPPAPVHPRLDGVTLSWTRRSRAGWRWLDRIEVPLGEEAEAYRVTVTSGDGPRELVVAAPAIALLPAELMTGATVTVSQRGNWAESPPMTTLQGG